MPDNIKRLRERELARIEPDTPARAAGSPGIFLISNASTTTKAGQFFAANPATIVGAEVERGLAKTGDVWGVIRRNGRPRQRKPKAGSTGYQLR